MTEIPLKKYKWAYHNLMIKKAIRGFKVHATINGFVNTGLTTLNMLPMPQVPWFVGPLVGWGAELASHYNFGVRRYPKELEENEMKAERLAEQY